MGSGRQDASWLIIAAIDGRRLSAGDAGRCTRPSIGRPGPVQHIVWARTSLLVQNQYRVLTARAAHLGQTLCGGLEAVAEKLDAVAVGIVEIDALGHVVISGPLDGNTMLL